MAVKNTNKAKDDLNLDYVKSILSYESTTGVFTWLVNRGRLKNGDVAGTLSKHGYWVIKIDYKTYKAHRLAWLIIKGVYPEKEIDHKDGNPSNNKFDNLREASRQENSRNRSTLSNNKLGLKGIRQIPSGKYRVTIYIDGKGKHLGYYNSRAEAEQARIEAEHRCFGKFARTHELYEQI